MNNRKCGFSRLSDNFRVGSRDRSRPPPADNALERIALAYRVVDRRLVRGALTLDDRYINTIRKP